MPDISGKIPEDIFLLIRKCFLIMHNMINDIHIINTSWQQSYQVLKKIRTTVFIEEQQVPSELEWDEFDQQSKHFLAFFKNIPIATARLKPDGQIGRMAVLEDYRHQGVATKLLKTVLSLAKKDNYKLVYIHAQIQVIEFYKKFDFIDNGTEFLDAGIMHRAMFKQLNNS